MGEERESEDPWKIKRIVAAAYDYENDPRWSDYWSNVLAPPHLASRSEVISHFKHKFYQRFIKHYLRGPLFGPYSFINIFCGKEEIDDLHCSKKNMLEVAIATQIVHNLYKEWKALRQPLSIVVASPYKAQVVEIKEKLGDKYKSFNGFVINVTLTEQLQGNEEDIVILSTVRSSNSDCSVSSLSDHQRVDVASIRARQCLWILGNELSLSESDSEWKSVIDDAKDRKCFHNINEDKYLFEFVVQVKKELDQLDESLDADNSLFRNSKWKVLFSENFRMSFEKIEYRQQKKLVIHLLLRLSNGWRPKRRNVDVICDRSKHVLKQFKVKDRFVICSVDVVKEDYSHVQVLRVWDFLPLSDISKLVDYLDSLFCAYTGDFLNLCKTKRIEGDLEIPMIWEASRETVRLKKSSCNEEMCSTSNSIREVSQDSKVSDSVLLMKFYSISTGMVSHLLSGCNAREIELPFELTAQEMEIVHFDETSFVLGRSGTGKTTVMIRKLFQREQLIQIASEGLHELGDCSNAVLEECDDDFLRQIFVTLNPRLCSSVRKQFSDLKRFSCGGKSVENEPAIQLDDINDMSYLKDIPDSFVGLAREHYPFFVPFHKFLMMLDGTLGDSFFNRFPEARSETHDNTRKKRSIALDTFIQGKEVDFEKFDSCYWPQFKTALTKNLKSLTAFTEIMSHIKGGLKALDAQNGKISREDYVQMSKNRVSNLDENERESVYEIFLQYEKRKTLVGEYDLADLVIDIHRRFREREQKFVHFDFVYIDEVQDLTMGQIVLFKYLCRNVDSGFVFAGDTAQTIAKGVHFRFEDIRHLFHSEFIIKSRSNKINGKGEKGLITEMFQLSHNYRTHAGVLKLAQSVIDLICRFFPQTIDFLIPETSLIPGRTPVLFESLNKTEFTSMLSNEHGFGADQVVLVRDKLAKNELLKYSGSSALVLTIAESKGLEFRDVVLYDFLSSSPLKDQWNIIYTYMKEKHLIHQHRHFPSFDNSRHRFLCSELKQLYVAITRTKQWLWILETGGGDDGFVVPVCEYWKSLNIVEVQQLDRSSFAEIQVSSTEKEWKSAGSKFFSEKNYEAAKICFGRAGDTMLQDLAEATGLQAKARNSNSETSEKHLTEAANMFLGINKFQEAALCFYELKHFETAGSIYLEKIGGSKLQEAGDCFMQARSYKRAAFAYAKGRVFSCCLDACIRGKLYRDGLGYVRGWKTHAEEYGYVETHAIAAMHQKLLEGAAHDCNKQGDKTAMMEFVKSFCSQDSMRSFLKIEGCYEELLEMEIGWRNFESAAKIAKRLGDTMQEVEMLEKNERFEEASLLLLSHVLAKSIWSSGSRGWPLKKFEGKSKLLHRAEELAAEVWKDFSDLVCVEKACLSDENAGLFECQGLLIESERHQSVGGQILSTWKILDEHFSVPITKYKWLGNIVTNAQVGKKKPVSVETLVFYWNQWKEKVGKVLYYLEDLDHCDAYGKFCLNYMGVTVTKHFGTKNSIYLIHNSNADWVVKSIDRHHLHREGKIVFCEGKQFAHAAARYWSSELLSVGMKVLKILRDLYQRSNKLSFPVHWQTFTRFQVCGVGKFLEDHGTVKLGDCVDLSWVTSLGFEFLMDWRATLTLHMAMSDLTLVDLGSMMMAVEQSFLEKHNLLFSCDVRGLESEVSVVVNFHIALQRTYFALSLDHNDCMSPNHFTFLVERVLAMTFFLKGSFLSTKSAFLEFLINDGGKNMFAFRVEADWERRFTTALEILAAIVFELLSNEDDVCLWINNSKLGLDCHSLLVFRLFAALCLICVNSRNFYGSLLELLGNEAISSRLPREFYDIMLKLKRGNLNYNAGVIADAFASVGNSLVAASSGKHRIKPVIQNAIFIDLEGHKGKEKLIDELLK